MCKSISLGRGIPIDLNQLATASNTEKAALRSVAQAGGPVYGGMGMSLFKFLDGGGYGWDDRKRYEYIMPRFLKSVSTGFRAFEEGRERNAKGETVLRYDRTDPWQVAETIGLGARLPACPPNGGMGPADGPPRGYHLLGCEATAASCSSGGWRGVIRRKRLG